MSLKGKLFRMVGVCSALVVPLFAQETWLKQFSADSSIMPVCACPATGGGYILVGRHYPDTLTIGALVIRVDENGDLVSSRLLVNNLWPRQITQAADGGYFLTTDFGSSVVKLDSSLNVSWARRVKGNDFDIGVLSWPGPDSGCLLLGNTWSFGYSNVLLSRLDKNGDLKWSKVFGQDGRDSVLALVQTDNGILLVGMCYLLSGSNNAMLIAEIDTSGNVLWSKRIGYEQGGNIARCVMRIPEGYFISGTTGSCDMANAIFLKIDTAGHILRERAFGIYNEENVSSVALADDGGFILFGYMNSMSLGQNDVWIMKADTHGNLIWSKKIGTGFDDRGQNLFSVGDSAFVFAGSSVKEITPYEYKQVLWLGRFTAGGYNCMVSDCPQAVDACDFYVIPLDYASYPVTPIVDTLNITAYDFPVVEDTICYESGVPEGHGGCQFSVVVPITINGGVVFRTGEPTTLHLYTVDGRLLSVLNLVAGDNRISLPPGVYLWRAEGRHGRMSGKAVVR